MIRTPGGYGPQPQIRSGFQGPASGGGGGRSLMQGITGGRELRYNRLLDKMGSPSILFKVPQEWGTDENNVVLGLSSLVNLAAAASGVCQVNVPRDLILRRLILVDNKLITNQDFTVTAITIEGNSVLLGNAIAGAVFAPNCYWSPAFDLPVAGGTPVTVSITNTSAAAASFYPCFTID